MRALSLADGIAAARLLARSYAKNVPADIDIPFPSFRFRIAVSILFAC